MPRSESLLAGITIVASGLHAQEVYDATIQDYVGHRHTCDGNLTPVLRIINSGSVVMSACVIDIWKNGIAQSSFDWQLAIAAEPGEEREPVLPALQGISPSDQLEFRIISVNGVPDEVPEGNIFGFEVADAAATDGPSVVVRIVTSDGPEGTVWAITDPLGAIVAEGGPYQVAASTHETAVELDAGGCYRLEVFDPSTAAESGTQVQVSSNGVEVLEQVVAAGELLREGLSIGTNTSVMDHVGLQQLVIHPNPTNGVVQFSGPATQQGPLVLEVFDVRGTMVQRLLLDPARDPFLRADLSILPSGSYLVRSAAPGSLDFRIRIIIAH